MAFIVIVMAILSFWVGRGRTALSRCLAPKKLRLEEMSKRNLVRLQRLGRRGRR